MTDIRRHGFTTKAELDEHMADAEDATAERLGALPEQVAAEAAADAVPEDLTRVRRELALLREQIQVLREQAEAGFSRRVRMPDSSARPRPGSYDFLTPDRFLKLAGAVTLAAFAARALRFLRPAGMIATPLSRFERR
jgi:hypothetical protein